ncbi:MAG: Asp-tRNA(Asn)/Glu-tRNA(Gln) amidotransferase subunit GatC [Firmicutes bacterium]|nr:Asp-tRNA(Asn)/Glu-tRNA(Gln) amidotransferase subunit GatC [Bacillota bacterium]
MDRNFSEEVAHVSRLARLELGQDEKEQMAGQLQSILGIAKKIQELDTSGVEPTSHVINLPAVLRDDEVRPSLPVEQVLQNSPKRNKDYFQVPRITAVD